MKIKRITWNWCGAANQDKFNMAEDVALGAMDYISDDDYGDVESAQEAVNEAVGKVFAEKEKEDKDYGNYFESCCFSPVLE